MMSIISLQSTVCFYWQIGLKGLGEALRGANVQGQNTTCNLGNPQVLLSQKLFVWQVLQLNMTITTKQRQLLSLKKGGGNLFST